MAAKNGTAKSEESLNLLVAIEQLHNEGKSACCEIKSAAAAIATVGRNDREALNALLSDAVAIERRIAPLCTALNEAAVVLNEGQPAGYGLAWVRERVQSCSVLSECIRAALSRRIDALFAQQSEMLAA